MTNQHDPPEPENRDVQVTMVGDRPTVDHRLLLALNAWPGSTIEQLEDMADGRRMVVLRWPWSPLEGPPF